MTDDFLDNLQKCHFQFKKQKTCEAFSKSCDSSKCEHYFVYRGHRLCSSHSMLDESLKAILAEHRMDQL